MPYAPFLATQAYLLSPDRSQVLLLHRNLRPDDIHYGKYVGLGGKLEPDEDVASGIVREVFEESGLRCERPRLRGTINWKGFGKGGEDWFCFLFLVERWTGRAVERNHEGTLEWVPVAQVLDLPVWEGDRLFLPLVFDPRPGQFHGVMPYAGGKPIGWRYTWLEESSTESR